MKYVLAVGVRGHSRLELLFPNYGEAEFRAACVTARDTSRHCSGKWAEVRDSDSGQVVMRYKRGRPDGFPDIIASNWAEEARRDRLLRWDDPVIIFSAAADCSD